MSFWDSLSNFISKGIDIVKDVGKAVGKVIVERSIEFLKTGTQILKLVTSVIETVAKELDIIKPEDNIEDLGDRAMRADKKIEDFENTTEYINYLKYAIKPKPRDEFERLSPEERVARRALGASILSKAIEEKYDMKIPVEFWAKATRVGLNDKEIQGILQKFKDVGIEPEQFVRYLEKELEMKNEDKVENVLVEVYKKIAPNMSLKEIEERVLSLPRKI